MNITKKCRQARKLFSAVVIASFLTHQMLLIPALAVSDISNVTNTDGVGNSGTFNIDPTGKNGDVGFRKYNQFQLGEGDIANFIMNYDGSDISKFVNLVNNRIDINGIVNTLRADGNFSNGGLVFISPEGMVVGASGVLNVGSLQVMTPTQTDYEKFKGSIQSTPTLYSDLRTLTDSKGTGIVTIAGKVISRDTVDINAAGVNLLEGGGIIAGVDHNGKIDSLTMADALFTQLVNIDGLGVAGNSLRNNNGVITITSYGPNEGMALDGLMKNVSDGTGSITLTNEGSKGMTLSGEIDNNVGTVTAINNSGALTVSGDLANRGTFTTLTNNGTNLTVSGDINNSKDMAITNSGTGALLVSGNIYNGRDAVITNNGSRMEISGTVDNGRNLTLTNNGAGGLKTTAASSINNAGILKVDNKAGVLNMAGTATNTGSLTQIDNSGTSATLSGTINNTNKLVINNASGSLNVGGTVNNGQDAIITNKGTDLNVSAVIDNGNDLTITNNGTGAMSVSGNITNDRNATLTNAGSGLTVSGIINNANNLNITNTKGSNGLRITDSAEITNGGIFDIDNQAGALSVGGKITNTGSRTKIDNSGTSATISGVIDNARNLYVKMTVQVHY